MLLLNLWEELKGQVLRPLPLRLIHQDLDAGRLILRIGTVIQLIIYLHVKWNLTGYRLHTGLPCHHFWHWRTLKAWTLARWTKYATTEFLLNCSWFRCLVTCYSHSYLRLQTDDSGLASYVAGQIDRTLSWKVIVLFSLLSLSLSRRIMWFSSTNNILVLNYEQDVQWLMTITKLPILVKGVLTAEDSKCQQKAS